VKSVLNKLLIDLQPLGKPQSIMLLTDTFEASDFFAMKAEADLKDPSLVMSCTDALTPLEMHVAMKITTTAIKNFTIWLLKRGCVIILDTALQIDSHGGVSLRPGAAEIRRRVGRWWAAAIGDILVHSPGLGRYVNLHSHGFEHL
jgi:hypothetical protein